MGRFQGELDSLKVKIQAKRARRMEQLAVLAEVLDRVSPEKPPAPAHATEQPGTELQRMESARRQKIAEVCFNHNSNNNDIQVVIIHIG